MRPWECPQTDTRTHGQTQNDFIICPMLYAIAKGQIIIIEFSVDVINTDVLFGIGKKLVAETVFNTARRVCWCQCNNVVSCNAGGQTSCHQCSPLPWIDILVMQETADEADFSLFVIYIFDLLAVHLYANLLTFELSSALWILIAVKLCLLLLFHVSCKLLMCGLCFCFSQLELYFGSATAAAAAAERLHKMRDGIEIEYDQSLPLIVNAARKCWGRVCITVHLMLCCIAHIGHLETKIVD